MIWADGQRPVVACDGFPAAPERRERYAAAHQHVGVIRLDGKRSLEARQRVREPAQLLERKAAIAVRRRVSRIRLQCGIDLTNRRSVIAALMVDDADEMQALEMIGLDIEDLSIRCLRLNQATTVMQREGTPEDRGRVAARRAVLRRALMPAPGRLGRAAGTMWRLVRHRFV